MRFGFFVLWMGECWFMSYDVGMDHGYEDIIGIELLR